MYYRVKLVGRHVVTALPKVSRRRVNNEVGHGERTSKMICMTDELRCMTNHVRFMTDIALRKSIQRDYLFTRLKCRDSLNHRVDVSYPSRHVRNVAHDFASDKHN